MAERSVLKFTDRFRWAPIAGNKCLKVISYQLLITVGSVYEMQEIYEIIPSALCLSLFLTTDMSTSFQQYRVQTLLEDSLIRLTYLILSKL